MKHNLFNPLKLFQFTRRTTSFLPVIAFMVISLVGTAVLAKDAEASGSKPNVVLVHGAWADGSGWNQVIQRLQQKNLRRQPLMSKLQLEPEAQAFAEGTAKPPFLFNLSVEAGRTAVDEVRSGPIPKPAVDIEDLIKVE